MLPPLPNAFFGGEDIVLEMARVEHAVRRRLGGR